MRRRQSHASIQGEAGAIESIAASRQFSMNIAQCPGGRPHVIHADMRVVHDTPLAHRLLLVFELGARALFEQKRRFADADLRGRGTRRLAQTARGRQRLPDELA